MVASANLPHIDKLETPYLSHSGSTNENKIITSTSHLSAFNLQELKARLTRSNLFSLFNGLVSCDVRPVLLDCGASACTSPHIDDFEPGTLTNLPKPIFMEGVGGGVQITQEGILRYNTIDDDGHPLLLRVPGFYAPHLKQCLFSPQTLFMTSEKQASLSLSGSSAVLQFPNKATLTLHLDLQSRLFYIPCFHDVQEAANELLANLQLTQDSNSNLTRGQKQLLRFHHALCHIGFSTIRKIGKLGWLGSKGLNLGDPSTPAPLCASCQ